MIALWCPPISQTLLPTVAALWVFNFWEFFVVSWFLWPYWPKSEVKKTFTYLLNGFSVHCLCHSYLCLDGFIFLIIVYSIIVYIIFVLTMTLFWLELVIFTQSLQFHGDIVTWKVVHFKFTSYFTLFILIFLYPLNCVVVQALQHVIRLVTYRCQEHRHLIISNTLNWIF